ncbi:MAG TPA: NADH-quinone oxidoreductase subunit NuoE [bacterium]|nr:NADH-quinone oxidoreductase subunit NuoE [bacterium]
MERVLRPAVLAEISRLAQLYAHPRSALLPALHAAQDQVGYLSEAAMTDVADALGLPVSEVASVATFYSMFHPGPVGRHQIRVCTNLSCYLNGCGEVLDRLCGLLGIRPGETTPDGRVTLEAVECLAACEEAPVMLVDADRHPRMTSAAVDDLLGRLD